jgi:hypothetical protein
MDSALDLARALGLHPVKCSEPGCPFLGIWTKESGNRCPTHRKETK